MSLLDLFKNRNEKKPTQAYLDIAEIKDSVVVMKDCSLRLVMLCSAVNFDLKTEEEQEVLIAQYQGFLNSLNFPIQIVTQSRRIDLGHYLEKLKEKLAQEENELLKIQMADYIDFLKNLIAQANIMDKKFYIIVPYFPPVLKTPSKSSRLTTAEFETFKKEIIQRASVIASNLASLGLRSVQLNTQELIELFYSIYNLDLAATEKLLPVEELQTEIIKKE